MNQDFLYDIGNLTGRALDAPNAIARNLLAGNDPTQGVLSGESASGFDVEDKLGTDQGGGLGEIGGMLLGALLMGGAGLGASILTRKPPTGDYAPLFYSRLEKAVNTLGDKEIPVNALLNRLKKAPEGFSNTEWDWTGMPEFLNGKNAVTKSDILDHLSKNGISMTEAASGGSVAEPQPLRWDGTPEDILSTTTGNGRRITIQRAPRYRRDYDQGQVYDDLFGTLVPDGNSFDESEQLWRMTNGGVMGHNFTTLDAAQHAAEAINSYRPDLDSTGAPRFRPWSAASPQKYNDAVFAAANRGDISENFTQGESAYPNLERPNVGEYKEIRFIGDEPASDTGGTTGQYRSPHWPELGVDAHLRTTAHGDGLKDLLINEVQSDWHQEGRKRGYADKNTETKLGLARDYKDIAEGNNSTKIMKGLGSDGGFFDNSILSPDDSVRQLNGSHISVTDENGFGHRVLVVSHDPRDMIIRFPELGSKYDAERFADYIEKNMKNADGTLDIGKINQLSHDMESLERLSMRSNNDVYRHVADLGNRPPDSPFKDDWPNIALAKALRMAAEQGKDRVSIPYGESVVALTGGDESGQGEFYNKILEDRLNKLSRKLGGGSLYPSQLQGGLNVRSLDMTPELRHNILYKGVPLLSALPIAALLAQGDNDG